MSGLAPEFRAAKNVLDRFVLAVERRLTETLVFVPRCMLGKDRALIYYKSGRPALLMRLVVSRDESGRAYSSISEDELSNWKIGDPIP